MPNTIVLLPFAESNSFEHLVSTRGGNTVPETEDTLIALKEEYTNAVSAVRRANVHKRLGISANANASTLISALKNEDHATAKEMGAVLEQKRNFYIKAKANRDGATTKGWKNIDYENVVCADSENLAAALRKLQAEGDRLFIRGHCGKGQAILMSADGSAKTTVIELIKILRGKLNKKFPGDIIIFGCKSARDTVDSQSFARRFATELVGQGWIKCRFFGYNESLQTLVDRDSRQRVTTAANKAGMAKMEICVPRCYQSEIGLSLPI